MRGRMAKTGSRPSEAIDNCGKEKLTNEATFVHSGGGKPVFTPIDLHSGGGKPEFTAVDVVKG